MASFVTLKPFIYPTMSGILFDSDSRPQWMEPCENQREGVFLGGENPFMPFKGLGGAAAPAEEPRSAQLGPRGPVPTMDADVAVSLLGISPRSLANTPAGTPMVTPMGTPMGTPKSTPVASPNWSQGFFGPMSPEPLHLAPSHSRAAFLPPEFYLDSALPPQQTSSAVSSEPMYEVSHKRSRSPLTERGQFLTASNFSLPHRAQPYVECNASQTAIQALGLLEEEIIKKLGVISI